MMGTLLLVLGTSHVREPPLGLLSSFLFPIHQNVVTDKGLGMKRSKQPFLLLHSALLRVARAPTQTYSPSWLVPRSVILLIGSEKP